MEPGTYFGSIRTSSLDKTHEIPVAMTVTLEGASVLSLSINLITKSVTPDGDLKFNVEIKNIGMKRKTNVTMRYIIKESSKELTIHEENETIELDLLTGETETLGKSIPLKDINAPVGTYFLEAWAEFEDKSVRDIKSFEIVQNFWETAAGRAVPFAAAAAVIVVTLYFMRRQYIRWRLSKVRYLFPVDYKKLPQRTEESFVLGRIAETNREAYFDPKDLTTHVLIAGATGSGKSVGASVFVEEALERKIPVIVFDPTAQWTGFVKPCRDENLFRYYRFFGMDPKEAKSYKGMIFEVTDPHVVIDLKKYMNPGEITVFTLNRLGPGEYDVAVRNIINSIFSVTWEESTKLKMIIVFDEVHRLLEKYGGIGGYVSLEMACREFRKWGIGIIMCSQVLADFKEAIAGNVLTDIQMNTKSIVDIKKVESKYGSEYAQRISRQGVGVGMFQHPKYNNGKPYFVQFRPTYHNPHKITDEEMELYKEFARRLEAIEEVILEMKKAGKDVFDVELELKLARDKLKKGSFRIARIYVTSLEERLNIRRDNK